MNEVSLGSRSYRHSESGLALPTVVIVLALLAFMVAGAVTMSRDELNASRSVRDASVAQFAAQAGAEYVIAHWDTLGLDTLMKNPGDSLDLGWTTLEGGARYRVRVRRTDAGNAPIFSLRVEGRSRAGGSTPRWVAVNVETLGDQRFPWAIFGRDGVDVGGSGAINGAIGTNGDLELNDSLFGDAIVGGIVKNPGFVTGTVLEGAVHEPLDTIPCPTIPWGPAPIGGTLKPDGSFSASETVIFPEGTYYFNEFSKSGGDPLMFNPGESVVMFIAGKLSNSGGGIANPNRAADVIIYGCGSNTDTWTWTGSGDMYLAIYAPLHVLKSTGSGVVHGSVIGAEFIKTGPGRVVYDSSLTIVRKDGSKGEDFSVVTGSWAAIGR